MSNVSVNIIILTLNMEYGQNSEFRISLFFGHECEFELKWPQDFKLD